MGSQRLTMEDDHGACPRDLQYDLDQEGLLSTLFCFLILKGGGIEELTHNILRALG